MEESTTNLTDTADCNNQTTVLRTQYLRFLCPFAVRYYISIFEVSHINVWCPDIKLRFRPNSFLTDIFFSYV